MVFINYSFIIRNTFILSLSKALLPPRRGSVGDAKLRVPRAIWLLQVLCQCMGHSWGSTKQQRPVSKNISNALPGTTELISMDVASPTSKEK